MSQQSSTPEIEPTDETWSHIEALVEEIAALAKTNLGDAAFYGELLDRAVLATTAIGGAVWLQGPGDLRLAYQVNFERVGLAGSSQAERQHGQLLHVVLRSGQSRLAPPQSGGEIGPEAGNPGDCLLVLAPVVVDGQSVAVIELFHQPTPDAGVRRGYLRFLETLAELAVEHHTSAHLRELRRRETLWERFTQFTLQIHARLDLRSTAFAIANEGRRLIDCDRVSVLIRRGRKYRVAAISGVDSVNRRAASVRRLEQLARVASAADEPLWYDESSQELPPQIERPLVEYIDQSHARMLALLPLLPPESAPSADRRRLGVLVVEHFAAEHAEGIRPRTDAVCLHSETALQNALEFKNLPLMPLMRGLARLRWLTRLRQLPWTLLVLAAVVGGAAALVLTPADFSIEVRGELQPALRRDVFASADGVVSEILVEHGSPVAAGQPIARLKNEELDFESTRLMGELKTAQKRLDSIQAKRLKAEFADDEERRAEAYELTAEEEELKVLLASLDAQQKVLDRRREQLTIVSPIDGQVLTWDVRGLLESRPVTRGQTLLTVADVKGPWVLELDLPDDDTGHVLAAEDEQQQKLSVVYFLAPEPGVERAGKVQQIALATEADDQQDAAVRVVVAINTGDQGKFRPGTKATAKIDCGRRALGYVWFHELYDAIQSKLLF
jgi:multidrug efflux pump subunit AcrA (membrane-fusion protein)